MKKKWSYLFIILLAIFLVGFALDHITPASPVHAAGVPTPSLRGAGPSETEKESVSPAGSAQPVVFVVTGLVFVLFGVIALSPLLIEDPAQVLKEANQAGN